MQLLHGELEVVHTPSDSGIGQYANNRVCAAAFKYPKGNLTFSLAIIIVSVMRTPSRVQSHLRFPLTSLLGSAGNVRVLRTLATDGSPQSASSLARLAGLTPQGVRLVLSALAQQQQLVKVLGAGRSQLYVWNDSHPFAQALTTLFSQEQQRWDQLLDALRSKLAKHGETVRGAWLYGSVARGEDTPESDLDLALLVTSQKVADEVREALMPLEDEQHLRISVTALTPKELRALPDGDRWWSDVVRDARVLKGSSPLAAKRKVARSAPK